MSSTDAESPENLRPSSQGKGLPPALGSRRPSSRRVAWRRSAGSRWKGCNAARHGSCSGDAIARPGMTHLTSEKWDFVGIFGYPLVNIQKAIENGHL